MRRRAARRQQHPDEVVAGKDQRLLEGAGRDDDPLHAVAQQEVARRHGNEPALVDRERAGGREHLAAGQLEVRVAERLVDDDDARALDRGRERRLPSGPPAADHEHAGSAVLAVVAAGRRLLGHLSEAGDAAQRTLVQRPGAARPDHRPVVEADGRERAADAIDDREQVAVDRAPDVLAGHDRARAHGLRADADVGDAVDGHHAVGAVPRAAEQPARPVVLEAAREDAAAGRVERGAERVAGERVDSLRA